jgi:nucleotide-binding universal stress UspA family protein
MKKILVPIDYSKISKCAAEVAAQMAKKADAEVHLLHVIDFPIHDPNWSSEAAEDVPAGLAIGKIVKERLEKFSHLTFFEGVEVHTILREEDNIYETVNEVAKEIEADIIVMGTHSRSQINRFLIGSNTDRVIRISDVPVLSVKRRHEHFTVKNIAFASNFYGESYTVFETIKPFIDLFKAKVHFVKVVTPSHFEDTPVSRKLMEDFAKKFSIDDYTINIYNDHKVEHGINRFAKEVDADLISMETHGGNSIVQLVSGSIMGDVMEHADLPVLTIKIDEPKALNKGIFPEMR